MHVSNTHFSSLERKKVKCFKMIIIIFQLLYKQNYMKSGPGKNKMDI